MTKQPPAIPAGTLPSDVNYTTTSLKLPTNLAYEKWASIMGTLSQIDKSCQWWIGDAWVFGDHTYGERAAAVTDGESFQTCRNAGWVSRKFETSRRRDVLPWAYHEAVASLPPQKADELLDKVEANRGDWNRKKLREAVKVLLAKPVNEKPAKEEASDYDARDQEIDNLRGAVDALKEELEEVKEQNNVLRDSAAKFAAPEGTDAADHISQLRAENKQLAEELKKANILAFGFKKERDRLMGETASQQKYIDKLLRMLKKAGIEP